MSIELIKRLAAFKTAIRKSEGTEGPNTYNVLFGHTPSFPKLFLDMQNHPRIRSPFTDLNGKNNWTTAAGAYQFIFPTWRRLAIAHPSLKSFRPNHQELAADILIYECGAAEELAKNNIDEATRLANKIWASLPESPYAQRTVSTKTFLQWYEDALARH